MNGYTWTKRDLLFHLFFKIVIVDYILILAFYAVSQCLLNHSIIFWLKLCNVYGVEVSIAVRKVAFIAFHVSHRLPKVPAKRSEEVLYSIASGVL